jgi:hypothetical protein
LMLIVVLKSSVWVINAEVLGSLSSSSIIVDENPLNNQPKISTNRYSSHHIERFVFT